MQTEPNNRNEPITQTQVIRAMTMEQRWRVAQSLYATARAWKAGAMRALHPELNEADIREAVRRSFLHVGSM